MKDIENQSFDTTADGDSQLQSKTLDEWNGSFQDLTFHVARGVGQVLENKGILPSVRLNYDPERDGDDRREERMDPNYFKKLSGNAQDFLEKMGKEYQEVETGRTGDETYTVKKGQGFDAIAKDILSKENPGEKPSQKSIIELSNAIAEANGLDRKSSMLHPGMEIVIPRQDKEADQLPPGYDLPDPYDYKPEYGEYTPTPEELAGPFPPEQFPQMENALERLNKLGLLRNFEGLEINELSPNRPDGGQDIVSDKGVLTIWKDGTMKIQNFDGTGTTLNQSKDGYFIHSWGPDKSNNFDACFIQNDGSFTVTDIEGRRTTTWPDGVVKVQNPDNTGMVQRPVRGDKVETRFWGPNKADNYTQILNKPR